MTPTVKQSLTASLGQITKRTAALMKEANESGVMPSETVLAAVKQIHTIAVTLETTIAGEAETELAADIDAAEQGVANPATPAPATKAS